MAQPKNSPVNEAEIKAQLLAMEKSVNELLPHLNKAHTAFGGMEDQLATVNDLKNRIAKAKAVYGV